MNNVIILEKMGGIKKLLKGIINTITPVEVAQALSLLDFDKKYIWAINNMNPDTTIELSLTGIKKYLRFARQVEIELDWLHNYIKKLFLMD